MKKNLPIFPDGLPIIKNAEKLPELKIRPDSITISAEHIFELRDVKNDENIEQIILWLYNYPERKFYLFLEEGQEGNRGPLRTLEAKGILVPTTELNYFKHPSGHPKDYIEIKTEEIDSDWERDTVNRGPRFSRIQMMLSERKRRELEIKEKIDTEKLIDVNPVELKPNFMGIGIDLRKAYRWSVNLFKKLKSQKI